MDNARSEICGFLHRLFRRRMAGGLVSFSLRVISVLPVFWFAAISFLLLFGFYQASAWFLWLLFAGLLFWISYRFPWSAVPLRFDPRECAAVADRLLDGRGRIESAACFLSRDDPDGLVSRHLAGVAAILPARMAGFSSFPRPYRLLAVTGLLFFFLQCLIFPGASARGGDLLFGLAPQKPLRVRLIYPGSIAGGGSFVLRVQTRAQRVRVELDHDGERYAGHPERVSAGHRLRVERVARGLRFRVSAEQGGRGYDSGWRRVSVLRPLYISSLRFRIQYPAYTRRASETVENESRFRLPLGSRIRIEGVANLPISGARMRFSSGGFRACVVTGNRFVAHLRVRRKMAFRFLVSAGGARTNGSPLLYTISLQEDRPPTVRILSPPGDALAPRRLLVPLVYDVSDEYGVAAVRLEYTIHHPGSKERGQLGLPGVGGEGVHRYVWDVNRLPVSPGESIHYRISARDRLGQIGQSRIQILRLPTLSSLFVKADKEQQDIRSSLKKMIENRVKAEQRLQRLQQERENTGRPNSEDDLREGHRLREERGRLQKRLKELEQKLRAQEGRHEQGPLFSEKTVRSLQRVREALQRLQIRLQKQQVQLEAKGLPRITPEKQRNLEARLQKKLKRLLEALDRMERDRKLDAARSRIAAAASALKKSMAEKSPARAARQLQEASRLTRAAGEALQKAAGEQPSEALKQALQAMAKKLGSTGASGTLQKMSRDAARGEMRRKEGERLHKQLERMRLQLASLTARGQNELATRLRKLLEATAEELLFLTDRFAAIRGAYHAISRSWVRGPGLEQDKMLRLLTQIGEERRLLDARRRILHKGLSGLFFRMPPPLLLLARSDTGLLALQERIQNRETAGVSLRMAAVGRDLGNTVLELLKLAERMRRQSQKGGKGGGQQSLQGLAGQQQKLDDAMQRLLKRAASGALSPGERRQLEELAAMQRLIRQALGKGARPGGQEGVLGDRKRLMQEMKKVEDALASGRLDKETYKRERRILQRLLRGTKAMRRMGKKRRRKAASADGDGLKDSGGGIPARLLRIRKLLDQSKRIGSTEGRELYRRYLKALYREIRSRE